MGKVRELREEAGIKQEEFAEMLEMSPANYSKKERGEIKYSLEEAKKVADFFEKSIEEIFFAEEVSKTETNEQEEKKLLKG